MKTFRHNNKTYSVQDGLLFGKTGSIWGYVPYISDGDLHTKAIADGWRGNISDDLIDDDFHVYKGKQPKTV